MSTEKYLNDISEIKSLMTKSSRFISLSGISGIIAGIYALIGAGYAYWLVHSFSYGTLMLDGKVFRLVLLDLLIVLVLSVGTSIFLTTKRANKNKESYWNTTTKNLLASFLIPLVAGGLYILIILSQGKYGQSGGLMLIFYGLALYNASKHTLGYIKYLGLIEISLGLTSAFFPGLGFWFWVIGFGFMHIIYGILMYYKYERK
ncbi:hypothetical protein [Formosa sp. PL04]|uniref:hypothetical protein n=1 Tax=Formosa sp. PL04 TaxID=3081755 RepID=UPI00298198A1|nr:hypothetical protein [Formosa sp. PL04]MDW5288543.1 hypothetical protein [Formosa sp. PL04]